MKPDFMTIMAGLNKRLSHKDNGLLAQLWDITTQHAYFHSISKIALNRESCLNNRYLKDFLCLGHISRHCLGIRSILFDHQSDVYSLSNVLKFIETNSHALLFENFKLNPIPNETESETRLRFAKFCNLDPSAIKNDTRIPLNVLSDLSNRIRVARQEFGPFINSNFAHRKPFDGHNGKTWKELDGALLECWSIFLRLNLLKSDSSISPIGLTESDILYRLDLPALDAGVDYVKFEREIHTIIAEFYDKYSLGNIRLVTPHRLRTSP